MGRAAHENSYQIPVFYSSSLEKKTELTTYKMSISGSIKRLIPLFDRIVVQRVAAGPGARNDRGDTIPMSVQVGDTVILPEYGGTKLEFDKQEYALFRESDIVAKLGKE